MIMATHEFSQRELMGLVQLLDSSSEDESSSDGEDFLGVLLNADVKTDRPKVTDYIGVVQRYSDAEFKRNFHLSRSAAGLVEQFEASEHMPMDSTGGSKAHTAEMHILSFLWYAGNNTAIRDVAGRFGVGESSLHRMIYRVMKFLVCNIAPTVITFPSTEISNFPHVLGAIDGSYINIKLPAHKMRQKYINRHDTVSVTLQAICDHQRKFIDVFTGMSSRSHDSRIIGMSFISHELKTL